MNNQQENPQAPPPNYLVWSILTTILCCLPFGIISIIYAAQVNSKWVAGDFAGAQNSSRNAKIWAWVSFGVGIAGIITWIILAAVGVAVGGFLEAFDF
ncbi:MAG: CD225/dispanin family protein [Prolixibacteraceae bacterium]|nr:CD225/dispanin family protein [Prolixibacteraceae bacterium]